jgi:hypothetical protein
MVMHNLKKISTHGPLKSTHFVIKKPLHFFGQVAKTQNGIFVDLGNIIPFSFPLKIAPSGFCR